MFRTLLVSAVGAGLLTGIVAALLQFWLLVPVIGASELYESGALTHFGGAEGHGHADEGAAHSHAPAEAGAARYLGTLVMTTAAYLGFALLLVAGFAVAERAGLTRISAKTGVLWGLAGFAATQLFPAIGMPPELPGSAAAPLSERQVWWIMTVFLSGVGLAMLAWVPGALRWAGVLLIVAPHVIAAPHPEVFTGVAPPEMAALFAARALGVGAIAWAVLGGIAGLVWQRQASAG
ncbi:CbtA family protein [Oceanibium sediminis]|uniref:CbtA family protein n=1 Tax=Oceanibium sediminis TaxID=2026339 RepID=UPI000DD3D194|nr:CbtA family protein [Oceanibium sediminis]